MATCPARAPWWSLREILKRLPLASLRVRLVLLVLLAVVPAWGLILYTGIDQHHLAALDAQADALRLARLAASMHQHWLDATRQLLLALAQLPAVASHDSTACSAQFADLLRENLQYANLGVVAPDGNIFCSALPFSTPVNAADRAWFQRAVQFQDFAAGDYQIGRITGKATINFAYPVLDETGQVQAVVFAALDLLWLNQLLTSIQLPAGATFTVVDRQGTILARSPDPEQWVGQSIPEAPIVQTILTQGEGTAELPGLDGIRRLYAFAPMGSTPSTGPYVAIGIPSTSVFAVPQRLLVRNLAGLGLVGILALVAAWAGSQVFVLRQIQPVVRAAHRLSTGDLTARSGLAGGQGELGQLARTFDHMAGELAQRDAQLRQALAERTSALETLQREQEFIRTLLENLGEGVVACDADGNLALFNRMSREWHGVDVQHLPPEQWASSYDLYGPDGVTPLPTEAIPLFRAFQGERVRAAEITIVPKGQPPRYILASGDPLFDVTGHKLGAVVVTHDITERKRAEQALKMQARALESMVEGVQVMNNESVTIFTNPAFDAMFGYERGELLGQSAAVLNAGPPEEQVCVNRAIAEHLQAHGVWAGEIENQRKDGTRFTTYARISTLEIAGKKYWVAVQADITEHRQLEAQLRQAQKMESVGRLAGGVAHDFNNLLTAILGYGELAGFALPQEHPARKALHEVQQAAERATTLTRQLLAFARRQVIEPKVIDLNELVLNLDKLLRRLIGEDIELVTPPAADLWPVKIDPGQLEQVLVNLAVNARDAMPQGGNLTIETANVILDQAYTRTHTEVTPGPYVLLTVSDMGIGMTDEVKGHLFEPFFTTKEAGKGTGLGLATCYGIVKQSGGHIGVYSEVGQGTVFKIYLPRAEGATTGLTPSDTTGPLPQGTETVLLVEDEPAVRALAERVLREQGYTVLVAAHGAEALQLCEQHTGPIHLLVGDMVMPQLGGMELGNRLRAVYPELKILLISGYTDNTLVRQGKLGNGHSFLQKPFTLGTLVRKVRQVLDAP